MNFTYMSKNLLKFCPYVREFYIKLTRFFRFISSGVIYYDLEISKM